MWIPKRPKPGDFCGCPPCPICFDWQSPEADTRDRYEKLWEEKKIMDGMTKFLQDMAPQGRELGEAKTAQLKAVAEEIHEKNKAPLVRTPEDLNKAVEYFHKADEDQRLRRFLQEKRREREKPQRAPLKKEKVLDHMDLSNIGKPVEVGNSQWGGVGERSALEMEAERAKKKAEQEALFQRQMANEAKRAYQREKEYQKPYWQR